VVNLSLRSLLTTSSIIAEAQRQFQRYMGGDNAAIHPSLRLAVFNIAIRFGGTSEYEAVKQEWTATSSIDGKEIALASLGRIQDSKTLLPDFLSFIFSTVAIQDIHTAASALAINSKTRAGLWEYTKMNWQMVREKLGGNMVVLDRFLRLSLDKFTDLEVEQDIVAFFRDKDNRGYDRTLGVMSDTIKGRAGYRKRDKEVLLEWLKTHGYA
jgi:aminopeptidase N